MSGPPVTLVCCGLTGTTVADAGMLERAYAEAFATQGIVPGTAAYARSMVHAHHARGQAPVDVFRALFPDAQGRAEAAAVSFERSLRAAIDRSGVSAVAGAQQAIDEIRSSGTRVCLVTGLSRRLVGLMLDAVGWWRRIDLAIGPEDVPRGMPWPDLMLTAMLRLGVEDVRETAFAGTTESGALCGKRSGASIVAGILADGHTEERLRGAGVTHVIPTIADLPALVASTGEREPERSGAPAVPAPQVP